MSHNLHLDAIFHIAFSNRKTDYLLKKIDKIISIYKFNHLRILGLLRLKIE